MQEEEKNSWDTDDKEAEEWQLQRAKEAHLRTERKGQRFRCLTESVGSAALLSVPAMRTSL